MRVSERSRWEKYTGFLCVYVCVCVWEGGEEQEMAEDFFFFGGGGGGEIR